MTQPIQPDEPRPAPDTSWVELEQVREPAPAGLVLFALVPFLAMILLVVGIKEGWFCEDHR